MFHFSLLQGSSGCKVKTYNTRARMTYLSMTSVFYLSNLKIKPLLWTRNWWCQTDFQGFHICGDFLRVKVCIYLVGNYYIGIQIQIQGFFKLKGYQTLMSTV